MKAINDQNRFIVDMFNLDYDDVESINYQNINNTAYFKIKLIAKKEACPACGFTSPLIKNYIEKRIKHSALSNRPVVILYQARRYICPICHKTYYEANPFVFNKQKISTLTITNCLNDLKDPTETFSGVARRYNISPTSVSSIFDKHVTPSRLTLPEVINFDEVYAFRSEKSKYVCILLDYQSQIPIDILPSRRLEDLEKYFRNIPLSERRKVKIASFDMYDGYRTITKEFLPNALCSLDKFHLIQEFNRKLNSIRIRVMKGKRYGEDEYYLLKHFNFLLFKNLDAKDNKGKLIFDYDYPRKYNHHFDGYFNYYDLRKKILETSNELHEAYKLKEELHILFKHNNYDSARSEINTLIRSFLQSSIEEMNAFGRTLRKWKDEIINSFLIVNNVYMINNDTGEVEIDPKHISNAIIENRNKVIKTIKHNANGYTNWERFRKRVLYVLRPNENYRLNPTDLERIVIPEYKGIKAEEKPV